MVNGLTSQPIVVESLTEFIADNKGDRLWKALKLERIAEFYSGSKASLYFGS